MVAHGLGAQCTVFNKSDSLGFAIFVFLLFYLQINNVARYYKGYEYGHLIDMGNTLAFGCHSFDGHVFQYG